MAAPARRPTSRRPQKRRTARARRQDPIAVACVLALFAVVGTMQWIGRHRGIAIAVGVVLALGGAYWLARTVAGLVHAHRARWSVPTSLAAYLSADPEEFEHQTAALCRRDGCSRVRVVGGAGDLAADVLATAPNGKRILIQCKRYAPHNSVGSDHVQRVNGTYRDIHRCEQAIIVTTSYYTIDARKLARRVGIRLIDAEGLAAWARGGRPPWV